MSTHALSGYGHRSQSTWSKIAAAVGRFLNRVAATNARNGATVPFGL